MDYLAELADRYLLQRASGSAPRQGGLRRRFGLYADATPVQMVRDTPSACSIDISRLRRASRQAKKFASIRFSLKGWPTTLLTDSKVTPASGVWHAPASISDFVFRRSPPTKTDIEKEKELKGLVAGRKAAILQSRDPLEELFVSLRGAGLSWVELYNLLEDLGKVRSTFKDRLKDLLLRRPPLLDELAALSHAAVPFSLVLKRSW